MGLLRILFRALFGPPRHNRHFNQSSGDFARYEEPPIRRSSTLIQTERQSSNTRARQHSDGLARYNQQRASQAHLHQKPGDLITGPCWVIDGDTIDINGIRIRLYGIDAPEMNHPYGNSAKWALVRLCKRQSITAVFEHGTTYDRAVATCYLPDGRDLSAEMVRAGMAIDWRKFSGGKYRALEPNNIRKKLWECDARQKGLMPPTIPD